MAGDAGANLRADGLEVGVTGAGENFALGAGNKTTRSGDNLVVGSGKADNFVLVRNGWKVDGLKIGGSGNHLFGGAGKELSDASRRAATVRGGDADKLIHPTPAVMVLEIIEGN